jgi:23S rRNA (uracil1939-C5)-methyltransferase
LEGIPVTLDHDVNRSHATIESLDQEGRGIAHVDGKVIFIEGGLPGETVTFQVLKRRPTYDLGSVTQIIQPSAMRVTPRCPHFGVCGGCSMQHLEPRAQVAVKQRALEDNLERIGKVTPEIIMPAIHGPTWEYRYRARFAVHFVPKKGGSLVGFRERKSTFVTDMTSCEVVPARISRLLRPLRKLINDLTINDRVPQIELAIGQEVDVLVLRNLEPLAIPDEHKIRAFADQYQVQIFLQSKGPETAAPFHPIDTSALRYLIPDFSLEIPFLPTDFTQVNHEINRVLVRRTMAVLDPQPGERVADMFCGLGNFSLAIARLGAQVVGIEGNPGLVKRAARNATVNRLESLTTFLDRDLFQISREDIFALGNFDRMLIDPPRDGAVELIKALDGQGPRRIVYVSCNPGTLARDAAVLVHQQGYRLCAAGVINMFPHTSHVESVAMFDKASA